MHPSSDRSSSPREPLAAAIKESLFGQSAEQGTLADAVREDALVEMESAVLAVLQFFGRLSRS